ncbi:MAG: galactose oxidase-like domain-containing protein [Gemmatimonadales bacterium]
MLRSRCRFRSCSGPSSEADAGEGLPRPRLHFCHPERSEGDHARCGPGPYMLFLLNEAGVPSVAQIVMLSQ